MNIRNIHAEDIIKTVAELCIKANRELSPEIGDALKAAAKNENGISAEALCDLADNIKIARESGLPVCQDTGMAVIFAELGQNVHITGGCFEDAVNEGVRRGYTDGFLRCSVVADPLRRVNTGDNTPCVLHTRIVPGDRLRLTAAPKGFGSENMSAVRMLTPSAGREDIISAVTEIVKSAGGNPCPPVILGVGIGGDFEYSAILAKRALCRDINKRNSDLFYSELENDILKAVNSLNIGPQGFGGRTTALAVNIEAYPTHIAGLPVAVNVGCYVNRHAEAVL